MPTPTPLSTVGGARVRDLLIEMLSLASTISKDGHTETTHITYTFALQRMAGMLTTAINSGPDCVTLVKRTSAEG